MKASHPSFILGSFLTLPLAAEPLVLIASQDSDVYGFTGRPTSSLTTLGVSNSGPGEPHSQRSLLQFDFTDLFLRGAEVGRATLRLYLTEPDPERGTLLPGVVEILRQNTAWTESGLTWPHLDAVESHGSFYVAAEQADSWVEFDLTSLVKVWVSGESANHGLQLRAKDLEGPSATEASLNLTFLSREVPGYAPQLVIEAAAPEPPQLTLQPTGDTLTLFWPADSPWTLQTSPDLSPLSWQTVEATPTTNGDRHELTLPRPDGTRFYRLQAPATPDDPQS
ncbi:DNRLRE domain-containing protein [Roseibacillus ishigakijimensis]|uniref:DNRLRE domain-containing protein n=1 Tax=Roseibacillus ishigakijimensis TaxID=454146 RepID=A0A934RRU8_9BACT|nr:DNRLRE domain-containing protein [Roseibacillus ishigakijimensis]MBK1833874.1 DNRLRE domain-containing protein [Roseibacillus ishigakijimensis]